MVEHNTPQPIVPFPVPPRLADAVARELARECPSPERLAEGIRAYALEAYARDVAPERMLVSLKALVAAVPSVLNARDRAAFTTALIPFALEGYYLDSWMRRTGEVRQPQGRTSSTGGETDADAS